LHPCIYLFIIIIYIYIFFYKLPDQQCTVFTSLCLQTTQCGQVCTNSSTLIVYKQDVYSMY